MKREKKKVWKDIDEVVKASSLKDKEKDIFKIMSEVPKGEKALKKLGVFYFSFKGWKAEDLFKKPQ